MTTMTTTMYSCRVEFSIDAIRALNVLLDEVWAIEGARLGIYSFDHEVEGGTLEFWTTFSLDEVIALFDRVPDTHVMQKTLRVVPPDDGGSRGLAAEPGPTEFEGTQ
jgi:hypothetical protein